MDIRFHCDDRSNFSDGQLLRGFSYKDYTIDPHSHDFYEINIILKGRGSHQIEERVLLVQAGDVFVIPPNVSHAYYNTERLEVYHILARKELIRENEAESRGVPGFVQLTELEPFLRQNTARQTFLRLNGEQLIGIRSELAILSDSGSFGADLYQPMKIHTLWKLLYYFSYLLNVQDEIRRPSMARGEAAVLGALEYIHAHYEEKITLGMLCSGAYLSRSAFLRHFKEICGCTPAVYLQNYRIQKALELFEKSELSKTAAVQQCGFYDISHFYKALESQKHGG